MSGLLDELFVTKKYRNQDIGRNLFQYVESCVKDRVDVIGTIATSYQYKELLDFYIEDLGMTFNHALLVKKV